jgi:hypothetical protein
MSKHDDPRDSRDVQSQESRKNSISANWKLQNTREAVEYGERANFKGMLALFRDVQKHLAQNMANLGVKIQLINEAYHAYVKDDWYESYQKTKAWEKENLGQ